MNIHWFSGLKGEEKDNFKKSLLESEKVLDKLREIVYNRLREKQTVTTTDYSSPSWAYLQAHQNGAAEELRHLLTFLEINDK